MHHRFVRSPLLASLAVFAALFPAIGTAANYTWIGSGNWFSTGLTLSSGNWNPTGGTLAPGDTLIFNEFGSLGSNQNGNAQVKQLFLSGPYVIGSTENSTLTISELLTNEASDGMASITNPVEFVSGAQVSTHQDAISLSVLTGSGNFTKTGAFSLTMFTASAYSGTMTVSEGTVYVIDNFGGSISIAAGAGGSFGSARAVNQAGGFIWFQSGTVSQASTLNGVNSIESLDPISTMTFGAALTLGTGNDTTLRVAAPGVADEYVVNGLLTYGGSLSINFTDSGTQANGTTWSLLDPLGGVSGSFAGIGGTGAGPYAGLAWGLATSSTNTFDNRYGAGVWLSDWTGSGATAQRLIFNQATGDLTVVPEPSTFVMAGAGIAAFALRRWRRARERSREPAPHAPPSA